MAPRYLAIVLVFALAGCESPRSRVHGTLKYQGQPLSDVTLIFLASDNQTYPAYPKADGTYEVVGLPRGKVQVSIQQNLPRVVPRPERPPSGFPEADADDAAKGGHRPPVAVPSAGSLPPKYADPEQSGLEFELTEADQLFDMDLR